MISKCTTSSAAAIRRQSFRLTWRKDVRMASVDMCWDVSEGGNLAKVMPFSCHGAGGNQYWKYDLVCSLFLLRLRIKVKYFLLKKSMQLKHGGNPRCLDMDPDAGTVFVSQCIPGSQSQKWKWQKTDEKKLENWDADPWP